MQRLWRRVSAHKLVLERNQVSAGGTGLRCGGGFWQLHKSLICMLKRSKIRQWASWWGSAWHWDSSG